MGIILKFDKSKKRPKIQTKADLLRHIKKEILISRLKRAQWFNRTLAKAAIPAIVVVGVISFAIGVAVGEGS